jgi:dihydrofolate synthase/folylpolyglutamate synthase
MRTYTDALDYLNHFISYERQQPAVYSPETLSLDRVHRLLDRLERPDRTFPAIHIAGTKGKGSTAAMIEAGLRAAGYRTGLYTSPHLHTFRERIRVNNELITREDFARLVDELEPHIAAVPGLTWFEIVTALAFVHFAQARIEAGVIEVGLGGRFDATNVLTPLVSVITSLSLDHMNLLGPTLAHIAFEKAGIIKRRVPVVSAPQPPDAFDVLRRVARFRATTITLLGRDVTFRPIEQTWVTQRLRVNDGEFQIPLLGAHQVINAATAITALHIAGGRGLPVGDDAIRAGLRQVQWPGRLEILSREPLLVVDGAHNGDSAQQLARALRQVFGRADWTLIIGVSADKDIPTMLDALLPSASRVIVTRARSVRAADVETLGRQITDRGRAPALTRSVPEALDLALQSPAPIIVTGSLFTVADARAAWFTRTGQPFDLDD